jgi:hypothetical protein
VLSSSGATSGQAMQWEAKNRLSLCTFKKRVTIYTTMIAPNQPRFPVVAHPSVLMYIATWITSSQHTATPCVALSGPVLTFHAHLDRFRLTFYFAHFGLSLGAGLDGTNGLSHPHRTTCPGQSWLNFVEPALLEALDYEGSPFCHWACSEE